MTTRLDMARIKYFRICQPMETKCHKSQGCIGLDDFLDHPVTDFNPHSRYFIQDKVADFMLDLCIDLML